MKREPVCGKDFCDACGDCLYCYWDDECYHSGTGHHYWHAETEEEATDEGD
jgi:hypothetical protein